MEIDKNKLTKGLSVVGAVFLVAGIAVPIEPLIVVGVFMLTVAGLFVYSSIKS